MDREGTIKKYLREGEKDIRLFGTQGMPADVPDALVFIESDCAEIVDVLKNKKNAAAPVKRIIVQMCVNHAHLRGWLKNNGYIIYGEDLWKEGDAFCATTAAVIENMAGEDEIKEAERAAYAEVHYYGKEETYNEFPLLLRVNNNRVLPEYVFFKIAEETKIANDIVGASLPEEMLQKKRQAMARAHLYGIAGNAMYPID